LTSAPILLVAFAMVALTGLTSFVARRLHVPQSILLVMVGAILAFMPNVPAVELDPHLLLLLFLPPLLYYAGVGMSWRGFKRNLAPIMLMAVGCVLFTATAVAATTHWLLHLPWDVGFVLGAVVSPPDAVAPMAIARRLLVPKRLLIILEGEGLVNDATALILFSFAVGAVTTGHFSLAHAAVSFSVIVVGEIGWGLAIGSGALYLRALARDPDVEMILALLTPFAAFWPPHFLGGSGVLAAVTAGLYTSWNGPRLIAPATRLQGFFVWGLVVYIVEGVVFFLTGLQSRVLMEGPVTGEWPRTLRAAAITIVMVLLIRFVWVFAVAAVRRPPQRPSWQETFLIGFTGIRGVVSLVAALSIPDLAGAGRFPERDLILFVTFCLILVSLLGQGALLPRVIRYLKIDKLGQREAEAAKRAEVAARVAGIDAALHRLGELEAAGQISPYAAHMRRMHEDRRLYFTQAAQAAQAAAASQVTSTANDGEATSQPDSVDVRLLLLKAERESIAAQFASGDLSDEARRRIERELDLEDARVRHTADSATGQSFGEL
jgi:CPA1 family monovalent cation:H+ antiporter